MHLSANQPYTAPHDQYLAELARPDHGVLSQDPNPAAQIPQPLEPAWRSDDLFAIERGRMTTAANCQVDADE